MGERRRAAKVEKGEAIMAKCDEVRPFVTKGLRYGVECGQGRSREVYDAGTFPDLVQRECDAIATMLIGKNQAYGNSALDPLRIFSQADRLEQLKVRIDDKLSRIAKGHAAGEEVVGDLIGYLVLLRIAERKA
jgi:hypothetical protein